ncbi:uncharacterized protein PG986_012954 [Apiospora aurea]|uniref:Uncharacterized protein n=1 Tax=Apiospora aurea TaxID=335848 RepID=A0ABR1Q1G1_9PEZI
MAGSLLILRSRAFLPINCSLHQAQSHTTHLETKPFTDCYLALARGCQSINCTLLGLSPKQPFSNQRQVEALERIALGAVPPQQKNPEPPKNTVEWYDMKIGQVEAEAKKEQAQVEVSLACDESSK